MIVVVPEPPLLVPELATGAIAETAALRSAVCSAAAALAATAPRWIAVGADPGGRRTVTSAARGTFAGFGADVVVGLSPQADGPVDPAFPLPLLVAGWLAARHGVDVRGELLAPDTAPEVCRSLGHELAREQAGLLVVGDGAITHTEKAPGYLDERAGPFDAAVAAALAGADPAGLAALDPHVAGALRASGRAPWQVLAGAADGRSWRGELLYSAAPFGVAYHVAVWR